MKETIPQTQYAVQLIGPDKLNLNTEKAVYEIGPYQILCKVKAVGLCFSDLKLLKQFNQHVRKSNIVSGIDSEVLKEIPSYKPGDEPTVPGHEAFCEIIAVGDKVQRHTIGQRVLVQTDYRWLKTAESNSAFGYNIEGGLQQYVIMDERVIIDPDHDESFLIPVEKELSASSMALVEPWACVESSYVTEERNTVLPDGKLLVVADPGQEIQGLAHSFSVEGNPLSITAVCSDAKQVEFLISTGIKVIPVNTVDELSNEEFDDIIYWGSIKKTIEVLDDKLASNGIINIVLCGQTIGADVSVSVGRTHYGLTRWIGTTGSNASESYKNIPANGEIRQGGKVIVISAAGPMGQMHTIRLVCSGIKNISVVGTDFDDDRLRSLYEKAEPMAKERGVGLSLVNPQKTPVTEKFGYFAIMAPVAPLVAQAVKDSVDGTIINIFAGIPATVKQEIDLDTYIANRCFMFGTSGSRLVDMKIVLEKVVTGQLETDCSVDAVSGMAGAIEGIRAVEARAMVGKIIVYPQLKDLPLIPLTNLEKEFPTVFEKTNKGIWTKQAEVELLRITMRKDKEGEG